MKKNSNILLSSVALADFLVGAVSMPLTITLDSLAVQRVLSEDIIIYPIFFISVFVLLTVCGASFLNSLLLAWERYLAIAKWMEYKVLVTRDRVNKHT